MELLNLIGKTIANSERNNIGTITYIWFTDGTAVELRSEDLGLHEQRVTIRASWKENPANIAPKSTHVWD
jgi:hypothetical protein